MSTRGQCQIPKKIREFLGIETSVFFVIQDGNVIIKAEVSEDESVQTEKEEDE
jgi:bifunctional DNA-binding transcriptional regulator/antitoxin component of YhaV-PrlF toxin-antitoxin module